MKLIGLMLVRNEQWVLRASLYAALRWCDEVVVLDHASTDSTPDIVGGASLLHRVHLLRDDDASTWNEMDLRQRMLIYGRGLGGTHFALIDADEIVTADLVPNIRTWVNELPEGHVLEVPLIPVWRSLDQYRRDGSVWSTAIVPIAFHDSPSFSWRPHDGYQFHHRRPYRAEALVHRGMDRKQGVMHLQWANWRRLIAKHAWYKMIEITKWPGRRPAGDIDHMYSIALDEAGMALRDCPTRWWEEHLRAEIDLADIPWQEAECRRLWKEHGPETFRGLKLYGVPGGDDR